MCAHALLVVGHDGLEQVLEPFVSADVVLARNLQQQFLELIQAAEAVPRDGVSQARVARRHGPRRAEAGSRDSVAPSLSFPVPCAKPRSPIGPTPGPPGPADEALLRPICVLPFR